MNISPIALILSLDASDPYTLQRASILRLFGLDEDMRILRSLKSRGIATRAPQHLQVCEWNGVICSDNKVQKVSWVLSQWHLYLEWTPPCVTVMDVHFDGHGTCLNTRSLPRSLRSLRVPKCQLTGYLRLTCLPSKLELLSAPENLFEGTVSLMVLPACIQQIDLQKNSISCVAYSGLLLPETLSSADFRQSKVKQARALVIDGKHQKHRVFV